MGTPASSAGAYGKLGRTCGMKTLVISVALLLSFALTACSHKNDQAQNRPTAPPIVDKPNNPPTPTPTELPPSAAPVPPTPTAQINPPAQPAQKQVKKPHHPKPADAKSPDPKSPDTKSGEQASNTPPAEVSAIGQLSPTASSDLR